MACLFFFFLSLLLFSTQINARDSNSFGKFKRENLNQNSNNRVSVNEMKDQEDQNPTFIPESENGYGLYGHETTYNNNEELNDEKHDENVNFDDSFSTSGLSQTQESYKNYRDSSPKTTESYENSNKDMSYYVNSNGYRTEKREKEVYKGYTNNVERQGMSDTRFMANGNYYFDLDDERNHGRFYQKYHYNYKPTGYNEKSSFENPYNFKKQSEMFVEEQGGQFTP